MSNNKHTPGPWYQQGDIWILGPNGETIAQTSSTYEPSQRRRNANLIATAPELLAACKRILYVYEQGHRPNDFQAALEGVKQAIAKAEGR